MSKIIKKQLKRSMPWLLGLFIFSAMAVGAVFSFDIKLKQLLRLEISQPEVNANADYATTTVVVLNAAPVFSTNPYESAPVGGSTSTSPINASSSISFSAVADDVEGNRYYLIVCSTSTKATAGATGGVPSCAGGGANTFCTSASTTSSVTATCTYAVATSTLPEMVQWWGFVCDDHTTQADCSLASQGSGYATGATSSSPFYINHRPVTTLVRTSVDNQNPGGTFTVQASTTDSDVYGGDDDIVLQVCSTNSWATTTGCGGVMLCAATSTEDPSCNFTIATPMAHLSYNYYAFIKDSPHNLDALPQTNPWPSTTYTVNDVAPTVGNVTVNNGAPITLNLRGATPIVINSTSTVSDANECNDLVSATTTLMYASLSTTSPYICSPDDNNCYKTTTCLFSGCVGGSASAVVTCSTTLQFYANPTDAGYVNNPYAGGDWRSEIKVFDQINNAVGTSTNGVELNTSAGINVTEALIDYGTLRSNFDTGDINSTTTVQNYGNSPLNTSLLVYDMATSTYQPIRDLNQKWSVSPFNYGSGGTPGSSTTPGVADTVCAKPKNMTIISDEIYWGLYIPPGIQSGIYKGQNTFTAVVDDNAGEW